MLLEYTLVLIFNDNIDLFSLEENGMKTLLRPIMILGTAIFLLGIGPCDKPAEETTTTNPPVVETEEEQVTARVCTREEQKACIVNLFQCLAKETENTRCTQELIDKCEADQPMVAEDIPPEGSCNVCRHDENFGYMNSVRELERKFRCPPRNH